MTGWLDGWLACWAAWGADDAASDCVHVDAFTSAKTEFVFQKIICDFVRKFDLVGLQAFRE